MKSDIEKMPKAKKEARRHCGNCAHLSGLRICNAQWRGYDPRESPPWLSPVALEHFRTGRWKCYMWECDYNLTDEERERILGKGKS